LRNASHRETLTPAGADTALRRLRAYYEQTRFDYRLFWLNSANRAIHFGFWDAGTRSHAESLVTMNRVVAARARLRPGMRVLDAGCGIGGPAMWLAEEHAVTVVGVNMVEDQVDRARREAARRRLGDRVSFAVRDFSATGFDDGSFDVVWAQESVCHARDKRAFLHEARRLLRPGGRLVLLDYFLARDPAPGREQTLLRSWLSGWAIPGLAADRELIAWARECGLDEVRVEDLTPGVARSHRRLHRLAMLFGPGELLLRSVRLRSDVQHGNVRGARAQYRCLRLGLWFEGILSATSP